MPNPLKYRFAQNYKDLGYEDLRQLTFPLGEGNNQVSTFVGRNPRTGVIDTLSIPINDNINPDNIGGYSPSSLRWLNDAERREHTGIGEKPIYNLEEASENYRSFLTKFNKTLQGSKGLGKRLHQLRPDMYSTPPTDISELNIGDTYDAVKFIGENNPNFFTPQEALYASSIARSDSVNRSNILRDYNAPFKNQPWLRKVYATANKGFDLAKDAGDIATGAGLLAGVVGAASGAGIGGTPGFTLAAAGSTTSLGASTLKSLFGGVGNVVDYYSRNPEERDLSTLGTNTLTDGISALVNGLFLKGIPGGRQVIRSLGYNTPKNFNWMGRYKEGNPLSIIVNEEAQRLFKSQAANATAKNVAKTAFKVSQPLLYETASNAAADPRTPKAVKAAINTGFAIDAFRGMQGLIPTIKAITKAGAGRALIPFLRRAKGPVRPSLEPEMLPAMEHLTGMGSKELINMFNKDPRALEQLVFKSAKRHSRTATMQSFPALWYGGNSMMDAVKDLTGNEDTNQYDPGGPVQEQTNNSGNNNAADASSKLAGKLSAGLGIASSAIGAFTANSQISQRNDIQADINTKKNFVPTANSTDSLLNEWSNTSYLNNVSASDFKQGSGIGGILQGAVGGAGAGLALGPVGGIIGGAIGALGGIAGSVFGNSAANRKTREMNAQIDYANQRQRDNFTTRAFAIDANKDDMLANSFYGYGGEVNSSNIYGKYNVRRRR